MLQQQLKDPAPIDTVLREGKSRHHALPLRQLDRRNSPQSANARRPRTMDLSLGQLAMTKETALALSGVRVNEVKHL